jgi:hypothetical protein
MLATFIILKQRQCYHRQRKSDCVFSVHLTTEVRVALLLWPSCNKCRQTFEHAHFLFNSNVPIVYEPHEFQLYKKTKVNGSTTLKSKTLTAFSPFNKLTFRIETGIFSKQQNVKVEPVTRPSTHCKQSISHARSDFNTVSIRMDCTATSSVTDQYVSRFTHFSFTFNELTWECFSSSHLPQKNATVSCLRSTVVIFFQAMKLCPKLLT